MELKEGKEKFIQAWGAQGPSWGISKTMAQVHALLMLSPQPMNADQVMEELGIARGNAHLSIHSLIDMGLVYKRNLKGERKGYFEAEKDVWEIARHIMEYRRIKELDPMLKVLADVKKVKGSKRDAEVKEFREVTENIEKFAKKADNMLDRISNADEHWFLGPFMKLMR